jgi:hypothetical protein
MRRSRTASARRSSVTTSASLARTRPRRSLARVCSPARRTPDHRATRRPAPTRRATSATPQEAQPPIATPDRLQYETRWPRSLLTAVYLRLVCGQVECTCDAERYGPMHGFAGRTCRPPEDPVPQRTPEAELWLGTHPGDPARQVTDEGDQFLLDTLRRRPERTGGSDRPWSLRRHTALLDEGVGGR